MIRARGLCTPLLALGASLLLPALAAAAITIDTGSIAQFPADNSGDFSFPVTVANNPDRVLVVGIDLEDTTDADSVVNGVTFNGTAMTQASCIRTGSGNTTHIRSCIYYLVAPSVGASLTGPIGPVATNNIGQLNVAVQQALNAPIDVPLPNVQNIAVRVFDNNGASVACGRVYTNNPGGAGSHWW